MKIVVTGATGFVGRPLCRHLMGLGHELTLLSRDATRAEATLGTHSNQLRCLEWRFSGDKSQPNPDSHRNATSQEGSWQRAVQEADGIIHLAGESVAGAKWTPEYKEKIRASRVDSTRALVEAIARGVEEGRSHPAAFISTSAIGYYGDRNEETLTESSAPGNDFLAEVGVAWENEALQAEKLGVRVALMRLGIVLGPGGALERMLHPLPLPINPFKMGMGGPLGNGRQWMSWVHLDDVIGLYVWALTNEKVRGAINVTSPNPVINADFAHALGKQFHRPAVVPVPAFVLQAMLGEFAHSLLGSQRVLPDAALREGYRFLYPEIGPALSASVSQ